MSFFGPISFNWPLSDDYLGFDVFDVVAEHTSPSLSSQSHTPTPSNAEQLQKPLVRLLPSAISWPVLEFLRQIKLCL